MIYFCCAIAALIAFGVWFTPRPFTEDHAVSVALHKFFAVVSED